MIQNSSLFYHIIVVFLVQVHLEALSISSLPKRCSEDIQSQERGGNNGTLVVTVDVKKGAWERDAPSILQDYRHTQDAKT